MRGDDLAVLAWEGIAAEALEQTGNDEPPVDALELAACCGLHVIEGPARSARLEGTAIILGPGARHVRRHGLVAHETAHYLLDRADEPSTEDGAHYVSQALLLPRKAFERDLRTTWNPAALRAKHVNVSAERIVRRIVALRDAVATVIDNGRVKARVSSPWLPGAALKRLSRWERGLADEALRTGQPVQGDELAWAVPIVDGPWERVVIVAEIEQLSFRLGR